MRVVGIRELKNRLSEYLRMVRGGEDILITDRGEVIAELRQLLVFVSATIFSFCHACMFVSLPL